MKKTILVSTIAAAILMVSGCYSEKSEAVKSAVRGDELKEIDVNLSAEFKARQAELDGLYNEIAAKSSSARFAREEYLKCIDNTGGIARDFGYTTDKVRQDCMLKTVILSKNINIPSIIPYEVHKSIKEIDSVDVMFDAKYAKKKS